MRSRKGLTLIQLLLIVAALAIVAIPLYRWLGWI